MDSKTVRRAIRLESIAQQDTTEGLTAKAMLESLLSKNPGLSERMAGHVSIPISLRGDSSEELLLLVTLCRAYGGRLFSSSSGKIVKGEKHDVERIERIFYVSTRILNAEIVQNCPSPEVSRSWSDALYQGFRTGIASRLSEQLAQNGWGKFTQNPDGTYVSQEDDHSGTDAFRVGRKSAMLVDLKDRS